MHLPKLVVGELQIGELAGTLECRGLDPGYFVVAQVQVLEVRELAQYAVAGLDLVDGVVLEYPLIFYFNGVSF